MVYVIATIQIAEGCRDEFLSNLRSVVPMVRQEDGCVEYTPTADLETNIDAQGELRDHVITIVEKWERLEALEAHLVAPHMVDYRAQVKELVANVKLQVLSPA